MPKTYYVQEEDGVSRYLLEDGSGSYLLEDSPDALVASADTVTLSVIDQLRSLVITGGVTPTEKGSADTVPIRLTESHAFFVARFLTATDTAAVSVNDSRVAVLARLVGDLASLGLLETGQRIVLAQSGDTVGLVLAAELGSIVNLTPFLAFTSSDTAQVGVSEAALLAALTIVQSIETASLGLAEDFVLFAAQSVADQAGIGLEDATRLLLALFGASDTTLLGLSEAVAEQFVSVIGPDDALGLGLIETLGATAVTLAPSENLGLGLEDTVGRLQASMQSSDTTEINLAEAAHLLVPLLAEDAAMLTLLESLGETLVTLRGEDAAPITVVDAVGLLLGLFASADAMGLTLSDETGTVTLAGLLALVQSSDTASLDLSDLSSLFMALAVEAADTLGLSLTEASAAAASLLVADGLGLTLDEINPRLLVAFTAQNPSSITVEELTETVAGLLSDDPVAVAISESTAAAAVLLQVSEELGISLPEAWALANTLVVADSLGLDMTDFVQQFISQGPDEVVPRIVTRAAVLTGGDDRYVTLGKGAS